MLVWDSDIDRRSHLGHPKARREVDIQHLTPKRRVHLLQAFACDQGTRIVDQDIQAAELSIHLLQQPLRFCLLGQIRTDGTGVQAIAHAFATSA